MTELPGSISRVARAWDRFWFEPADACALGVLRWCSAGMLLYTHWVWGLALRPFLGPTGWQDRLLVQHSLRETWAPSFWWSVPSQWLEPVHGVCLVVLLLYGVGLFHRVTPWLAFAITVSYVNRVPLANFGLDQINSLLVAYVAVGSLGLPTPDARLTADRAWWRWRRLRAGLREPLPPPQPRVTVRLAQRLIQVHLAVIYLGAGLSKLKGLSWWTGEAVWLAVANREYQSHDLTWLAWTPWLINLVSVGTVAWEMTFWLLVWHPRWRWPVLLAGLGMHTGIGAFLGMWTFGIVMELGYLAFVPSETWLNWGRKWFKVSPPKLSSHPEALPHPEPQAHPVGDVNRSALAVRGSRRSAETPVFTVSGTPAVSVPLDSSRGDSPDHQPATAPAESRQGAPHGA